MGVCDPALRSVTGGWRGVGISGAVDERYVTLEGVYRPVLRSVTRGWAGVKFSGKKRYVTLEWPPYHRSRVFIHGCLPEPRIYTRLAN